MGCLLRQAHPHLVLLGLFRRCHSKIHHYHEGHHHHYLHVRIDAEIAQQRGILVVETLFHAGGYLDVDHIVAPAYGVELVTQIAHVGLAVNGAVGLGKAIVALVYYLAAVIGQQHGDGGVALYDAEQEIHVLTLGILVARSLGDYLLGGVSPNLHACTLLAGLVLDKIV